MRRRRSSGRSWWRSRRQKVPTRPGLHLAKAVQKPRALLGKLPAILSAKLSETSIPSGYPNYSTRGLDVPAFWICVAALVGRKEDETLEGEGQGHCNGRAALLPVVA